MNFTDNFFIYLFTLTLRESSERGSFFQLAFDRLLLLVEGHGVLVDDDVICAPPEIFNW
jgi:hypothetical protein